MSWTLSRAQISALRDAFDAGYTIDAAAEACGVSRPTVQKYFKRWRFDPAILTEEL